MKHSSPLYLQMQEYLLELIERNESIPNYKLPSENQLAVKFGASRISAKHAFDTLEEMGLIYRQRGRGTFVATKKDAPSERGSLSDSEDSIALIVPFVSTIFMSEIIDAIQEELKKKGLHFVLFLTNNDQQKEQKYLRLAQQCFQGALLFPGAFATYHEEVLRLVLSHFPLVQIDRYLPGLGLSYVACDHEGATYRGAKLLYERGHQRVGFIGHQLSHASSIVERIRGFDRATQEFAPNNSSSFKLNVEDHLPNFDEVFRRYMAEMQPTAIISSSHLHAPSILRVLKELGEDQNVELMLYDNEFVLSQEFMAYHPFVIDQQPRSIGHQAAQLICELSYQGGKPTSIKLEESIYQL